MASSDGAPFDVVVVHSFSRFARDHFALEYHVRRLRKAGVRLVSMTQDLGDDPMSVMVRQVFALFDEYQGKREACPARNAGKRAAGILERLGGAVRLTDVAAEQRGAKTKKKLAVDPVEAETVRLIFRLVREGDGTNGPMGVKGVVVWLNGHGYRTRRAARWGIGPLHKLLTNPVYKGKAHFNRTDSKTRTAKPVLSTSSCRSIQSSTGYRRLRRPNAAAGDLLR
jgi:DNA invertase Pin-like site-specific DNA recombinase